MAEVYAIRYNTPLEYACIKFGDSYAQNTLFLMKICISLICLEYAEQVSCNQYMSAVYVECICIVRRKCDERVVTMLVHFFLNLFFGLCTHFLH